MDLSTAADFIFFITSKLYLYLFLVQKGVPAFTVSQPQEAMQVLKDKAAQLDVSSNSVTAKSLHCIAGRFYSIIQITLLQVHLQVASQLDGNLINGLRLGLAGEHQYVNAGLAIMLSSTWLQRTGHPEFKSIDQTVSFFKRVTFLLFFLPYIY